MRVLSSIEVTSIAGGCGSHGGHARHGHHHKRGHHKNRLVLDGTLTLEQQQQAIEKALANGAIIVMYPKNKEK